MVKGTPVGANRGVVGWMEMGKAEADRSPNSVEKKGGRRKQRRISKYLQHLPSAELQNSGVK